MSQMESEKQRKHVPYVDRYPSRTLTLSFSALQLHISCTHSSLAFSQYLVALTQNLIQF